MNQFYNLEENTISTNNYKLSKEKHQPSDMVIKNILNYSRALQVTECQEEEKHQVKQIHLILN